MRDGSVRVECLGNMFIQGVYRGGLCPDDVRHLRRLDAACPASFAKERALFIEPHIKSLPVRPLVMPPSFSHITPLTHLLDDCRKLDRMEDVGDNPKTGRLIEDTPAIVAASPAAVSAVKRGPGRPKKNAMAAAAATAALAGGAEVGANRMGVVAGRAVDPNAFIEPLRKKSDMVSLLCVT